MNKRGVEMGLSVIVLIVVALIVLTALVFLITKAFGLWNTSVGPISSTISVVAAKDACNLACTTEDKLTFCCSRFSLEDGQVLSCANPTLGVSCQLSCEGFVCPPA